MGRRRADESALLDLPVAPGSLGHPPLHRERSPGAAQKWIERLRKRARSAASSPRAGRHVPEVEREDVREVILGAYRIVYRVLDGTIHVLTVFEGHRQFPKEAVPPV